MRPIRAFFVYFVSIRMDIYFEKKLLRQVADGNEQAFRTLVFRYSDILAAFVFRLTRNRETTEELVQDVFLKIWMSREVLAEIEQFKAYLFIVSRNYTLNALRKLARERMRQQSYATHQRDAAPGNLNEEPFSPGLIDQAIEQLPLQQRRAWLLSRKQGFTHQQIATQMALSKETVKKYIMYANQSLIRYIKSGLSCFLLALAASGRL